MWLDSQHQERTCGQPKAEHSRHLQVKRHSPYLLAAILPASVQSGSPDPVATRCSIRSSAEDQGTNAILRWRITLGGRPHRVLYFWHSVTLTKRVLALIRGVFSIR